MNTKGYSFSWAILALIAVALVSVKAVRRISWIVHHLALPADLVSLRTGHEIKIDVDQSLTTVGRVGCALGKARR